MKVIAAFLAACGLVAAQSPQAPNPAPPPNGDAATVAAGATPVNRMAVAEMDRPYVDSARAGSRRAQLRAHLLMQLNAILPTRDTRRGLIVNMSDALFDTEKNSLRPVARERLAKVAGVVSGHSGLLLAVEGYTDSVGGDDYNLQTSAQRGEAVRDSLTDAGIPPTSVTAKGFGKIRPIASNDTAQGRQRNRRVELVVSGDIIGAEIGATSIAAR